jgi:hypothetical protein
MASVHYVLAPHDARGEVAAWCPAGQLDVKEWDGEMVVRCGASGATYLLSALATRVLKALLQGASHVDDVTRRVTEVASFSAATAELAALFAEQRADALEVVAALTELEALGLARSSVSPR